MDKFQFFLKKMFILVHNVSAGSKLPKPERLRALMEYLFSDNSKAFRRLIGFFGYNAKLIPQYSSRLQPLLKAQEQRAFTLSSTVISRINNIKTQIADACLTLPAQEQCIASGTRHLWLGHWIISIPK